MEFQNKNIVIAGAAGAFGRWITERFARRALIPLDRTSGPGDAPEAVAYLRSGKASFITGAVLTVDGGNSLGTFEPGELPADTEEAAQ